MKAILAALVLTINLGWVLWQFSKPAPAVVKAAPTIETLMLAVPGPGEIVTVAAAVRGPSAQTAETNIEDSIFTSDPKDARISLKKSDSALFEELKHEMLTAQQRRELKAAHSQMRQQIENLTREPHLNRDVASRKSVATRKDDPSIFESKKDRRKQR